MWKIMVFSFCCGRRALRAPRSPVGWSWQPRDLDGHGYLLVAAGREPRAGLRETPSRRLRDYLPHPPGHVCQPEALMALGLELVEVRRLPPA
jgi:hypothetical protein